MKPMPWSALALLPLMLPPGTAAPLVGTASQEAAPKPAQVQDELAPEFDKLVESFDQAQEAFYAKVRELYAAADKEGLSPADKAKAQAAAEAIWSEAPNTTFLPQFEELAKKAKGKPTALKSWLKVIELAQGPMSQMKVEQAVNVLLADHIESEELSALGQLVSHWSSTPEFHSKVMNSLREKSKHPKVKAAATLSLAQGLAQKDAAKAKALYQELMSTYAKLEAGWGGTFGDVAERALFEMEHLQIGMVAPDFESVDETGAKFKVSDYRGKVVVLDFWGYW
jgi:hypothetical protein